MYGLLHGRLIQSIRERQTQMRFRRRARATPTVLLGLVALTALMAIAFLSTTSAMAESTALCSKDESPCASENRITHIHETSVGKAKLESSLPTIECNVLFLGEVGALAAPQIIEGNFTYSSCNNFCTVKEENGPAEIQVLKTGSELGEVTSEALTHLGCPFINCNFNGEGLIGHGLGPLTSSQANGSVMFAEQETNLESGAICPEEAFLTITTTPLSATYTGSGGGAKKTSTSLTTKLKGGGKDGAEITVAEGSKVKDTATLSGENASKAGGTLTYKVYKDKECKELVTKAGEVTVKEGKVPDSEEKELEAGAVYYWQAEYGGDSSNEPSKSICGKEVLTVKAKTTLSTKLSGGGKEGVIVIVPESTKVKDQATLSGTNAASATGTVDYAVYEDEKCKELVTKAGEVTVKEGKVPGSEEKELEAGKEYFWLAEYLGDSLHEEAKGTCGAEIEVVHPPTTLCNAEPEEIEGDLYCPKGKGFSGDVEGELEPKTVATFESTEEPKEVISCTSSQIDATFNEDGTSPESGGITSLSFSGEGGSPCSVTGGEASEVEIEVEEGLPLNGTTLSYQQPPNPPLALVVGDDGARLKIVVIRGFLDSCTYSPAGPGGRLNGMWMNGSVGPPPIPSSFIFLNQPFVSDHELCRPLQLRFTGYYTIAPSPPFTGIASVVR